MPKHPKQTSLFLLYEGREGVRTCPDCKRPVRTVVWAENKDYMVHSITDICVIDNQGGREGG